MNQPLASILINNYNNGKFIGECVQSALDQSYPNVEVIVYDDESDDESISVLKEFEASCKIVYGKAPTRKHPRNQGNAVNTAFEQSKGAFIFLLDGDDKFTENKVEICIEQFQKHAVDFIQTPAIRINRKGERIGEERRPEAHTENLHKAILKKGLITHTYITSCLSFSRKSFSAIAPLIFPDQTFLRVDSYTSAAAIGGFPSMTIDQPLTLYRIHGANRSLFWKSPANTAKAIRAKTEVFNKFSDVKISPAKLSIAILLYLLCEYFKRAANKVRPKK
ncbi:MAG: glycosyltransferase [Symploca sp. SIO2D2]|nr:glycosyltransferase [Symploca sp. SIO2D2]